MLFISKQIVHHNFQISVMRAREYLEWCTNDLLPKNSTDQITVLQFYICEKKDEGEPGTRGSTMLDGFAKDWPAIEVDYSLSTLGLFVVANQVPVRVAATAFEARDWSSDVD